MRKYSKLFGAGTGTLIALILKPFIPEGDTAEKIGTALEILLPLLGTYLAPPNSPIIK